MNDKLKNVLKKTLVVLCILAMPYSSYSQKKARFNRGFVSIFNGENLDGWYCKLRNGDEEMAKKVFVVEDGMVHVFKNTPDSLGLNTGENGTHGLFYTHKKYSKYVFQYDTRRRNHRISIRNSRDLLS